MTDVLSGQPCSCSQHPGLGSGSGQDIVTLEVSGGWGTVMWIYWRMVWGQTGVITLCQELLQIHHCLALINYNVMLLLHPAKLNNG